MANLSTKEGNSVVRYIAVRRCSSADIRIMNKQSRKPQEIAIICANSGFRERGKRGVKSLEDERLVMRRQASERRQTMVCVWMLAAEVQFI